MRVRVLSRCIGVSAACAVSVSPSAAGLSARLKTNEVGAFAASGAIPVEFTIWRKAGRFEVSYRNR
jgi:hypothetical protein